MKVLVFALLTTLAATVFAQKTEKATFAGGCFWCTEEAFEKTPGVISARWGGTPSARWNWSAGRGVTTSADSWWDRRRT